MRGGATVHIETEAQFVWAKSMPHVDCQGYYISIPVRAAQIDELVMQHGLVKSSGYIRVKSFGFEKR
jgi:hypothetical protein